MRRDAGGAEASELPSGTRWRVHGKGEPVTLVAHGLGATEGEARIPASGLRGTRVVLTFPGHGHAPEPPENFWSYANLAADMLDVADRVGASQAVGVSMGAGALTRIAAERPERFERLALLLPAALDRPRDGAVMEVFERMAHAVRTAHSDGGRALRQLVARQVPEGTGVGDYEHARAATLLRLESALRELPRQAPLMDRAALSAVDRPVLVVGATSDPLHAREVAEQTARALPSATLELFDSSAPILTHRAELRGLLSGFLAAS